MPAPIKPPSISDDITRIIQFAPATPSCLLHHRVQQVYRRLQEATDNQPDTSEIQDLISKIEPIALEEKKTYETSCIGTIRKWASMILNRILNGQWEDSGALLQKDTELLKSCALSHPSSITDAISIREKTKDWSPNSKDRLSATLKVYPQDAEEIAAVLSMLDFSESRSEPFLSGITEHKITTWYCRLHLEQQELPEIRLRTTWLPSIHRLAGNRLGVSLQPGEQQPKVMSRELLKHVTWLVEEPTASFQPLSYGLLILRNKQRLDLLFDTMDSWSAAEQVQFLQLELLNSHWETIIQVLDAWPNCPPSVLLSIFSKLHAGHMEASIVELLRQKHESPEETSLLPKLTELAAMDIDTSPAACELARVRSSDYPEMTPIQREIASALDKRGFHDSQAMKSSFYKVFLPIVEPHWEDYKACLKSQPNLLNHLFQYIALGIPLDSDIRPWVDKHPLEWMCMLGLKHYHDRDLRGMSFTQLFDTPAAKQIHRISEKIQADPRKLPAAMHILDACCKENIHIADKTGLELLQEWATLLDRLVDNPHATALVDYYRVWQYTNSLHQPPMSTFHTILQLLSFIKQCPDEYIGAILDVWSHNYSQPVFTQLIPNLMRTHGEQLSGEEWHQLARILESLTDVELVAVPQKSLAELQTMIKDLALPPLERKKVLPIQIPTKPLENVQEEISIREGTATWSRESQDTLDAVLLLYPEESKSLAKILRNAKFQKSSVANILDKATAQEIAVTACHLELSNHPSRKIRYRDTWIHSCLGHEYVNIFNSRIHFPSPAFIRHMHRLSLEPAAHFPSLQKGLSTLTIKQRMDLLFYPMGRWSAADQVQFLQLELLDTNWETICQVLDAFPNYPSSVLLPIFSKLHEPQIQEAVLNLVKSKQTSSKELSLLRNLKQLADREIDPPAVYELQKMLKLTPLQKEIAAALCREDVSTDDRKRYFEQVFLPIVEPYWSDYKACLESEPDLLRHLFTKSTSILPILQLPKTLRTYNSTVLDPKLYQPFFEKSPLKVLFLLNLYMAENVKRQRKDQSYSTTQHLGHKIDATQVIDQLRLNTPQIPIHSPKFQLAMLVTDKANITNQSDLLILLGTISLCPTNSAAQLLDWYKENHHFEGQLFADTYFTRGFLSLCTKLEDYCSSEQIDYLLHLISNFWETFPNVIADFLPTALEKYGDALSGKEWYRLVVNLKNISSSKCTQYENNLSSENLKKWASGDFSDS